MKYNSAILGKIPFIVASRYVASNVASIFTKITFKPGRFIHDLSLPQAGFSYSIARTFAAISPLFWIVATTYSSYSTKLNWMDVARELGPSNEAYVTLLLDIPADVYVKSRDQEIFIPTKSRASILVDKRIGSTRADDVGNFLASRDYTLSAAYFETMHFLSGQNFIVSKISAFIAIPIIFLIGGRLCYIYSTFKLEMSREYYKLVLCFGVYYMVVYMSFLLIRAPFYKRNEVLGWVFVIIEFVIVLWTSFKFAWFLKKLLHIGYLRAVFSAFATTVTCLLIVWLCIFTAVTLTNLPEIRPYVSKLG